MEFNLLKSYNRSNNPSLFREKFRLFNSRVTAPTTLIEQENKGRLYYTFSRFLLNQKKLDSAFTVGKEALLFQQKGKDWKYVNKTQRHLALVAYHRQDFEEVEKWIDASYANNVQ